MKCLDHKPPTELRCSSSMPASITFRFPSGWPPRSFGIRLGVGREIAARSETKTGLRSIELRRVPDQWGKSFEFVVNDISVFAKGADVIPFDSFPNRVTPQIHRNILQSARDAHMNMVREWGGGYYESDDFYDICDELGIMVWQEFMFGGDMIPGDVAFQENVRQEASDLVRQQRGGNRMVALGRPSGIQSIHLARYARPCLAGLRDYVRRHSQEHGLAIC